MNRPAGFILIFSFFLVLYTACNVTLYNPFVENTNEKSSTYPETSPTPTPVPCASLPNMNPAGGTYDSDQSITLTCATTGTTIRYTTDGSDPDGSSAVYSVPIAVTGNGTIMTIKAFTAKAGILDSAVRTENYTINYSQVSTPLMSSIGATYDSDQSISLTCGTAGSVIRYTTNGTDPNGSSSVYAAPIAVAGHGTSMTIKAYATKAGMLDSTIRTENYTITYSQVPAPVMSTAGGTYYADQSITLTCGTAGSVIRYTTNGTDPNGSSSVYAAPITVAGHGTTMTIKAYAAKAGMLDSTIKTEVYTIQYPAILSITSSTSDGAYGIGANVDVTVNFNQPVTLAGGTLDITLDAGNVVSITAFGPAGSASCVYTVGIGISSNDLDATSVTLNGGTLRNSVNTDAIINLPAATIADSSSIGVDGYIPAVTGFSLSSGSPTTDHFITFSLDGSDSGTGITHWLINESATKPAYNDPGWLAVKPGTYATSTGYGIKSVYAWVKDGASNVSNATGGAVWSKEWNYSTGDDEAQGIAIDSNDNIYVIGYMTNGSGDFDWWMKKYDADGNEDTTNWNIGYDSGYGNDTAIAVAVDSSDNVYVAGRIMNSSGNIDGMVRKYTANGSLVWSREFDQAGKTDRAYSVAVDSDNNAYVACQITQADNNIDWCIKKYDSAGNEDTVNWNIIIDNGTDDVPWGITTDSGNNVYAGGRLLCADNDWAIIKFNSTGSEQFRDVITNPGNDWCRSILIDSMDYMFGTGGVYRSGTDSDWFVKKYVP